MNTNAAEFTPKKKSNLFSLNSAASVTSASFIPKHNYRYKSMFNDNFSTGMVLAKEQDDTHISFSNVDFTPGKVIAKGINECIKADREKYEDIGIRVYSFDTSNRVKDSFKDSEKDEKKASEEDKLVDNAIEQIKKIFSGKSLPSSGPVRPKSIFAMFDDPSKKIIKLLNKYAPKNQKDFTNIFGKSTFITDIPKAKAWLDTNGYDKLDTCNEKSPLFNLADFIKVFTEKAAYEPVYTRDYSKLLSDIIAEKINSGFEFEAALLKYEIVLKCENILRSHFSYFDRFDNNNLPNPTLDETFNSKKTHFFDILKFIGYLYADNLLTKYNTARIIVETLLKQKENFVVYIEGVTALFLAMETLLPCFKEKEPSAWLEEVENSLTRSIPAMMSAKESRVKFLIEKVLKIFKGDSFSPIVLEISDGHDIRDKEINNRLTAFIEKVETVDNANTTELGSIFEDYLDSNDSFNCVGVSLITIALNNKKDSSIILSTFFKRLVDLDCLEASQVLNFVDLAIDDQLSSKTDQLAEFLGRLINDKCLSFSDIIDTIIFRKRRKFRSNPDMLAKMLKCLISLGKYDVDLLIDEIDSCKNSVSELLNDSTNASLFSKCERIHKNNLDDLFTDEIERYNFLEKFREKSMGPEELIIHLQDCLDHDIEMTVEWATDIISEICKLLPHDNPILSGKDLSRYDSFLKLVMPSKLFVEIQIPCLTKLFECGKQLQADFDKCNRKDKQVKSFNFYMFYNLILKDVITYEVIEFWGKDVKDLNDERETLISELIENYKD